MSDGDAQDQDEHLTTRDEPVAICSVAWIELVDFARKPVREQMRLTAALNELITQALADTPAVDRIVLDTGEGAAVVFPQGTEWCLLFGLALRAALEARGEDAPRMRVGLNLGPVRLIRGSNGEPAFLGDGLAAAQRIAGFAQDEPVAASRSFYEGISAAHAQYASHLAFAGARTDSDVREHQVYSVCAGTRAPLPRPQAARAASFTRTLPSTATALQAQLARRPAAATALAVMLIFGLALWLRAAREEPFPVRADSTSTSSPASRAQAAPASRDSAIAAATESLRRAEAVLAASADAPSPPPQEPAVAPQEPVLVPPPVFVPPAPVQTEPASAPLPKPSASRPTKPAAEVAARRAVAAADSSPQPPASDQAAATGAVRLTVVPWGEIYLDGEKLGVAPPLRDVVLEPGVYRFEIRNPGFASLMQVVEVAPGEEVRIRHKFD